MSYTGKALLNEDLHYSEQSCTYLHFETYLVSTYFGCQQLPPLSLIAYLCLLQHLRTNSPDYCIKQQEYINASRTFSLLLSSRFSPPFIMKIRAFAGLQCQPFPSLISSTHSPSFCTVCEPNKFEH